MTLTQINKAGLDELALDHVFTIGASGTDHYTFQGEGLNGTVNDPTLYLTRGKTYRFENGTGSHPIKIQSTSGASGTAYNTGVTNNAGSGTVIVEVQHDAPDVLYYQCTSHANMNGVLYITGALADGGVTTAKLADDAVTDAKLANSINTAIAANTAKTTNATHTGDVTGSTSLTIANDAVTTAKIAANAVTHAEIAADSVSTSELASGAVTTVKIGNEQVTLAKLEHGTSSNDGKFLRANNGADPSFETVSIPAGTTINNNADNRVITGSGTANTLEGEANLVFNGNELSISHTNPQFKLTDTTNNTDAYIFSDDNGSIRFQADQNSEASDTRIRFQTDGSEKVSIDSELKIFNGNLFFGTSGKGVNFHTSNSGTANLLDDYEEGTWTPTFDGTWTNISASDVRHAKYTKIGNTVHYYMEFFMTGNNGEWATNSNLRGFPYGTPQSYYAPVNIAVMYGPSGFSMDQNAAGRAYFDGYADRLYLNMGTFNGVRHLWLQITITNAT